MDALDSKFHHRVAEGNAERGEKKKPCRYLLY
jgi:hypothetical protein